MSGSSVIPSLVVTPCAEAIDWYVEALGAEEVGDRMVGPDGSVGHAEIRFGDHVVMLADEWPDWPVRSPASLGASTAALHLFDDEVEAIWERAVAAGAEVIAPLELQFYGHLSGRLRDPFGHTWGLGRVVEEVSEEEMARRVEGFYEDLEG